MTVPKLSPREWQALRRELLNRAVELVRSVPKATELVDATIAAAIEPDATPWDPARETFSKYMRARLWSRHGTELASYRVTKASERITDDTDRAPPSSRNPDRLLVRQEVDARTERLHAEIQRRVQGDALLVLLMEKDEVGGDHDEAGGGGDETPGEENEPSPPERIAQPASTRRALAKGYTLKDIKNARERLRRHAEAVARADKEAKS